MCHAQWQYQYHLYFPNTHVKFFFFGGWGGVGAVTIFKLIYQVYWDHRLQKLWQKERNTNVEKWNTNEWLLGKNTINKNKSTVHKDPPIRLWMFTFIHGAAKWESITSNKERERNHIFYLSHKFHLKKKDILRRRHYKVVTNNSIFYKQQHKIFQQCKKRITVDLNN